MVNGSSNEKFLDIASSQRQFFSNYNTILSAIAEADPDVDSKIFIKALAAVAEIAALLSPDPVEGAINQLAAMLQADVSALEAHDAAIELASRTTTLNGLVSDTRTNLGMLQTAVDHPDQYPAGTLIIPVQECVNKFLADDDQIWNITYTTADIQKIYWSDQGRESVCFYLTSDGFPPNTDDASYGAQQPPLNDDGSVFDHRITLPMYLSVISAFLAIGRTLDPNFLTSARPDLVKATNKLQSIHDKLMTAGNGLTPLSPPSSMGDSVQNLACPEPVDGAPPRRPAVQLVYGPLPPVRDHAKMPPTVGAVIEYGAVEKFSGINSIGDGYQLNFAGDGDAADPALYNKLQIRVLKRMKDVYFATGLASVWRTINHLKVLTGSLISNAPSFADWSMREVLGNAKLPSQSGAQSLRSLAAFIVRTQPFDTPYTDTFPHVTVSMRQLLTNVPH